MIFFNVKEARNQLTNAMKVYTLRCPRATGITIAVSGSYFAHKEIYPVLVEKIADISCAKDLESYLDYSGFDSTEEWFEAAAPRSRVLYRATKYEGD